MVSGVFIGLGRRGWFRYLYRGEK